MIGMVIKQLKRSALRRALQSSFFESILAMLEHAPKRGKLETRYEVTWKWALTLCALMQQGVSESGKLGTIRKKAVEMGIHPGEGPSHSHHALFQSRGIKSLSDRVIAKGIQKLSNQFLLEKIDKKHRQGIEQPWQHIVPEDIGSCLEIVKEIVAIEGENGIELVYSDGRRKSGVHHTPFDVTRHMADLSIEKIQISDNSIPEDLVICDLSVGAGAFLLQFARIIANMTQTNVGQILEKHVIGFDIDPSVLQICSLCFHLERGCPNVVSSYHLHRIDSIGQLNSREKIKKRIAEMMPSSKGNPTITTGNPPYVRVKSKDYSHLGFQSNKCGNLSAYFLEQAIEVTEIGKVVCQIVPQSILQSEKMSSIRKILHTRCSKIDIEAYGCVPGYMFDQGKIGSNSSTSITQRVAIITAITGEGKTPSLTSTRFIRWGSKERDILFENLEKTLIPKQIHSNSELPMLCDETAKEVLLQIMKTNRNMAGILGSNNRLKLFVPKAVRYFCTAARNDMDRSQIKLIFSDIASRNMAQVLLNSSFFYWHWRIFGNGFQVSNRDLHRLPVPSEEVQKHHQKAINSMANRLHRKRNVLAISTSNKGMITNIKYDKDPRLMRDLDNLVRTLFHLQHCYPFNAAKENSLQGYQSHFQSC